MNKNSVVGVLVDWHCVNKKKDWYLLRATLALISAQRKKLQYDFQSNSIKNRTVLSTTYLACRLVRKKVKFTKKELLISLNEMSKLAQLGIVL